MAYHIDICSGSSYGTVGMLQNILSAPGVKVRKARIQTTGMIPDLDAPSSDWGLILECVSENQEAREFEIRVCMVTSGYGGTGPNDLIRCLQLAGVKNIDKNEIYSVGALRREYAVA